MRVNWAGRIVFSAPLYDSWWLFIERKNIEKYKNIGKFFFTICDLGRRICQYRLSGNLFDFETSAWKCRWTQSPFLFKEALFLISCTRDGIHFCRLLSVIELVIAKKRENLKKWILYRAASRGALFKTCIVGKRSIFQACLLHLSVKSSWKFSHALSTSAHFNVSGLKSIFEGDRKP